MAPTGALRHGGTQIIHEIHDAKSAPEKPSPIPPASSALVRGSGARDEAIDQHEPLLSSGVMSITAWVVAAALTMAPVPAASRSVLTGSIAGQVASNGHLLSGVTLELVGLGGGASTERRSVRSDSSARFVFDNVAAGVYRLSARQLGYVFVSIAVSIGEVPLELMGDACGVIYAWTRLGSGPSGAPAPPSS
jgi:hypothetical protein